MQDELVDSREQHEDLLQKIDKYQDDFEDQGETIRLKDDRIQELEEEMNTLQYQLEEFQHVNNELNDVVEMNNLQLEQQMQVADDAEYWKSVAEKK